MPNADVADTLIVTAEGGKHFAVAASDATIEPARALDSTRPLFTVTLDGAPGEELSGDWGRAWHAIAVMAAAESVGVAARVTALAVEYAKERKQFGRAIGSYQAVSHACAQMFLETEGARSVTYWAAWALDHDPENAFMAANCAKAYASDAAVNVPAERPAGPRRHRLHVGTRPAPVPQARRGQRARVRRRPLAPRADRGRPALDSSFPTKRMSGCGAADAAIRCAHGRLGRAGASMLLLALDAFCSSFPRSPRRL